MSSIGCAESHGDEPHRVTELFQLERFPAGFSKCWRWQGVEMTELSFCWGSEKVITRHQELVLYLKIDN